jgi:YbgC/YbaW family acyl-CoA thioester hydrolase
VQRLVERFEFRIKENGMSKIFTRTYRARYSEINANGQLTPADYARYILDTAYDWAETLGLGEKVSEELGLYWVIRETEIQFFGSLQFMEEFDFTIWMLDWKRVRGTRAFIVNRKNQGATIAQGVQQIACMDRKTQRPVSPPVDLIDNFRLDMPREIPSQRFPVISILPEKSPTFQIKVAWQDLDILDIANNANFIAYAEEAVTRLFTTFGWSPVELKAHGLARVIRRLHIQYQMPAVWGDTLNMTIFSLKLDNMGGSLCVAMTRDSDGAAIASCILDWGLSDRGSGEMHALPDSLVNALRNTVLDD